MLSKYLPCLLIYAICLLDLGYAKGFTLHTGSIDVRDACQMIARAGRFNIVFHRAVKGPTALSIKGLEPLAALKELARTTGFFVIGVQGTRVGENGPIDTFFLSPNDRPTIVLKSKAQNGFGFTLKNREIDVRDIFQMIARVARVNLIFDKEVRGKTSIEVKSIAPLRCLELMCLANGFKMTEFDEAPNTYVISKKEINNLLFEPKIDKSVPADFSIKNRDIDMRLILRSVAEHAGIRLRIGREIRGMIACELKNLRPLEVLKMLAASNYLNVKAVKDEPLLYDVSISR